MNYYELIYLKNFLKVKLKDSIITQATTRVKNVVEFTINKAGEEFTLVCSTSPRNIALFLNRHTSATNKNRILFFNSIYYKKIIDIVLIKNDRVLEIVSENNLRLVFKLYGSRANVFLYRNTEVLDSFKEETDAFTPALSRNKRPSLNPEEDASAEQKISAIKPILPRTHLPKLLKLYVPDTNDATALTRFAEQLEDELLNHAEFRILEDGTDTLFSSKILPMKTERQFENINEFIEYRYSNHYRLQGFHAGKNRYLKEFERQLKRLESSLKNLAAAERSNLRAQKYEKFGHLLMANAHTTTHNQSEIEVEDLFSDGELIKIPVLAELSIAENAERYYRKAKSSAASYIQASEQIPLQKARQKKYFDLKESLLSVDDFYNLKIWEKENKLQLKELMPQTGSKNHQNLPPFHIFEVDGYTIWIGKNARNNDILVKTAHKEDVWLHARGTPGSHVVIRMGNRKEMPQKNVIETAAGYAAFNSKAAGAELVPVIYTKKKFVRKPKNAAPGAVVVEREQVIMVEPKNPEL